MSQDEPEGAEEMTKYDELIEKMSDEIEEIKQLKAVREALFSRMNEINPLEGDGIDWDAYEEKQRLWKQEEALFLKEQSLRGQIDWAIRNAYVEVPFAKPREQVIKAFYKKAGI